MKQKKKYGPISSLRHDPYYFEYLTSRHFDHNNADQYEVVFKRSTPLSMEGVDFTMLGPIKLDKCNFAGGLSFVRSHNGEAYVCGLNCVRPKQNIVLVNLQNLEVEKTIESKEGREQIYPLGQGKMGIYQYHHPLIIVSVPNMEKIRTIDVPNLSLQVRHFWNQFDVLYALSHEGVLINLENGESTKIPGLNARAMYSPTLMGADQDYVMWVSWPEGNLMMMDRNTKIVKTVLVGSWKQKQYYDVLFSGTYVVWHNINHSNMHIVKATYKPKQNSFFDLFTKKKT